MSARTVAMLAFVVVALTIFGGVHYYLWVRLVRDPALPSPWTRFGTIALITLTLSPVLGVLSARTLPHGLGNVVAGVVYVWMGMAFLLFVGFFATDLVRAVVDLAARFGGVPESPERRQFVARAFAAGVGALALGTGTFGIRTALRRPEVRTVRVPLRKLPEAMAGFTIVQVTDVHVGPTIGRSFVEDLVRRVNALGPDVVAITGDLVDGPVDVLGPLVAPLAGLRAKHGVYFVTGNHEYYSGPDEWLAELGRLGIRVLRNEHVRIGNGEDAITLAGVDDWSAARFGNGHGADLARALEGVDEDRAVVLLAHQPKAAREASERGVGLVLSGHTHGGQIWPFHYLVKLDQHFLAGLHRVRDTYVYVNSGTGYWGPPMRLGTSAEITRIVLERAA